MPLREKHPFYGWKLVAALFALDFLNMGFPYYGGAVINSYMLRQIAMSRSTYGLGFTLLNLLIGVASVAVAASILKWGARFTFVIGSALIFGGALWLAWFARKPWHYLAAYGIVMGVGVSFSTIVPVTTLVARWFSRYRGIAMAIPLSASGVAGFVGAPLLNKLLTANGGNWRQAWLVVAAIAVVAGLVALLLVKERPQDLGQFPDGIAPSAPAPSVSPESFASPWTPALAYRTHVYWMIIIGGIACQFPYFFFVAHWILHLRRAGLGPSAAAWAMGVLTLGAIAGRIIGGLLMDRIAARFAFMAGLGCYFVSSVLALELPAHPLAFAFAAAAIHGIGFGWTFVCLNTITANYFGSDVFPQLNGMMMLLTGIACAPAGVVGGAIFDRFGSYQDAFLLNIVLAAVGIIALSLAATPRPKAAVRAEPSLVT
jgi:MFS family permease